MEVMTANSRWRRHEPQSHTKWKTANAKKRFQIQGSFSSNTTRLAHFIRQQQMPDQQVVSLQYQRTETTKASETSAWPSKISHTSGRVGTQNVKILWVGQGKWDECAVLSTLPRSEYKLTIYDPRKNTGANVLSHGMTA